MNDDRTEVRSPEETPTVVVGEASNHSLQLTPGTILGGRYRIVSQIGRGGMGAVYRADDLKLGQTVALKFLSISSHAPRLLDEVRIGRQISHPNVCRLYDVAEADGQTFITMEFVDGEDLSSLLRRVGRLPAEKALAVARDICAGLGAAHEKNVIHRDLKPANVMIDGRGRARVTDFGLAVAGEARDQSGTPAYMAPEQFAGVPASRASDIYALGLVLYEVFTGRRPFESTSTHDLMVKQQHSEYARPSALNRDVPAAVERIIVRCLDPEPSERPQSLESIARELPGGDTLSLAVAAGETPSPAMVAAASKRGDLAPPVAWSLLIAAVAGFLLNAAMADRHRAEIKAPDVLRERARAILADAGVSDAPRDSGFWLTSRFGELVAVYRRSSRPMLPRNAAGLLETNDPPLDAEMARVILDAKGSLIQLTVAPPSVESPRPVAAPSWDRLLAAAGFDGRALESTTALRAAPVDTDAKYAWSSKDGAHIEAASYHGRPVWFSTRPLVRHGRLIARGDSAADRIAAAMFMLFMILIPAAGLLMARTNLRRKQVDRAGTIRAATAFGVVMLLGLAFHAHHPMALVDEWIINSWLICQATFWALNVAIFYVALEPLVRRRWPQILISWSRVLSSRYSDAMVGRDILIGAAVSVVTVLLWQTTFFVSATQLMGEADGLGTAPAMMFVFTSLFSEALLRGFGMVLLLVLARSVIRHDVIALVLTTLLIAGLTMGDAAGPLAWRAVYGVMASLAGVLLVRQCGVLALMSYAVFGLLQERLPFTLDGEAWYFERSACMLALMIIAVVWAFRTSLGARRWLPRLAFET